MSERSAQLIDLPQTCDRCQGPMAPWPGAERMLVCENWHFRIVSLREMDEEAKQKRQRTKRKNRK
jgi:hypothetical protein